MSRKQKSSKKFNRSAVMDVLVNDVFTIFKSLRDRNGPDYRIWQNRLPNFNKVEYNQTAKVMIAENIVNIIKLIDINQFFD